MKKITFYKSMRDGTQREATGYYYKAQNGIEFAIDRICDWQNYCATELSTGLAAPILGGKTIKETCEQLEQVAPAIANYFARNITQIKQLRQTRAAQ